MDGKNSAGIGNLPSDFFYTWLNDNESLRRLRSAQPQPIRDLLDGYAAGYNRWLWDTQAAGTQCAGKAWLRPLESDDLLRLTRRLLVQSGAGQFAEAMMAATPPGQATSSIVSDGEVLAAMERRENFHQNHGSNAVAVGSERSVDGNGLLLANPHFPWFGALRFYQMHLTIPGQLDVMGASLPGMPLVNIGFGKDLAWSHTVDTSSHFTLYRLDLDPQDPHSYRVDGQSRPLKEVTLRVRVREADGRVARAAIRCTSPSTARCSACPANSPGTPMKPSPCATPTWATTACCSSGTPSITRAAWMSCATAWSGYRGFRGSIPWPLTQKARCSTSINRWCLT